jgi:hypothetical protein
MAKNKMNDLRDHLFETIEALKDSEKPMDLDRAKAISDVAQVIINTAKVEVDLIKAVGGKPGSQFIQIEEESRQLPRIPSAAEPRQVTQAPEVIDRVRKQHG